MQEEKGRHKHRSLSSVLQPASPCPLHSDCAPGSVWENHPASVSAWTFQQQNTRLRRSQPHKPCTQPLRLPQGWYVAQVWAVRTRLPAPGFSVIRELAILLLWLGHGDDVSLRAARKSGGQSQLRRDRARSGVWGRLWTSLQT